jgi:hypothetical protein
MFPDRTLAQLAAVCHGAPCSEHRHPGRQEHSQLNENLSAALLPPLTESELCLIEQVTPQGGGRKIWPA